MRNACKFAANHSSSANSVSTHTLQCTLHCMHEAIITCVTNCLSVNHVTPYTLVLVLVFGYVALIQGVSQQEATRLVAPLVAGTSAPSS